MPRGLVGAHPLLDVEVEQRGAVWEPILPSRFFLAEFLELELEVFPLIKIAVQQRSKDITCYISKT